MQPSKAIKIDAGLLAERLRARFPGLRCGRTYVYQLRTGKVGSPILRAAVEEEEARLVEEYLESLRAGKCPDGAHNPVSPGAVPGPATNRKAPSGVGAFRFTKKSNGEEGAES